MNQKDIIFLNFFYVWMFEYVQLYKGWNVSFYVFIYMIVCRRETFV